jgi:hypothetical protein
VRRDSSFAATKMLDMSVYVNRLKANACEELPLSPALNLLVVSFMVWRDKLLLQSDAYSLNISKNLLAAVLKIFPLR